MPYNYIFFAKTDIFFMTFSEKATGIRSLKFHQYLSNFFLQRRHSNITSIGKWDCWPFPLPMSLKVTNFMLFTKKTHTTFVHIIVPWFVVHLATYVNRVMSKEKEKVRNHNFNFFLHLILYVDTHVLLRHNG